MNIDWPMVYSVVALFVFLIISIWTKIENEEYTVSDFIFCIIVGLGWPLTLAVMFILIIEEAIAEFIRKPNIKRKNE